MAFADTFLAVGALYHHHSTQQMKQATRPKVFGGSMRNGVLKVVIGAVTIAAFAAGSYLAVSIVRAGGMAQGATATEQPMPEPVNPFVDGDYLVAFVVAASDCGWSTRPMVMDAVAELRQTLLSTHGASFAQIDVIGVALDRDLQAGLQFLNNIDDRSEEPSFDQISVGGDWLNENMVRLVWRERVTTATVPQIVLVQRPVDAKSYLLDWSLGVEGESVLLTLSGTSAISRWISEGAPLENVGQ